MQRICPRCHEELVINEHYYCGYCGALLSGNLILEPLTNKKVQDYVKQEKLAKKPLGKHFASALLHTISILQPIKLLGVIAVLLLLGVPSYYYLVAIDNSLLQVASNKLNLVLNRSTPVIVGNTSPDIFRIGNFSRPAIPLGQPDAIKLIPYSTDIVYEIASFTDTAKLFTAKDTYYTELVSVIEPYSAGQTIGYVDATTSKTNWAICIKLNDKAKYESISQKILQYSKYSWLKTALIGEYLVLTDNQDTLDGIILQAKGLSKNISMNPMYVSLKSRSPRSGLAFVGIVTGEGSEYVQQHDSTSLPVLVSHVLNALTKNTLNYIVVMP